MDWSPEQISGFLAAEGIMRISHESIYMRIWHDKANGGGLWRHLRQSPKRFRKRYRARDSRGRLAGKRHISERPPEVEDRIELGHWEIDTMKGDNQARHTVLTMVERATGYVTIGLVSGTSRGLAAAAFYSLIYVLMNLTCFWVICRVARKGENLTYSDLDGLYKRSPYLALVLAIAAFSLVGLPPTAGFMGKLFLLTSAWNHGYNWLVVVAAVNTAFAIYYYLGMVRHAYTTEVDETRLAPLPVSGLSVAWGLVLAVIILALGVIPAPIFDIAASAGTQLLP